jgi:glycosyltransferase involved in cell wall biosynthesis
MIVYNSRSGAAQHEQFGYSFDKRTVIYNGFDTKVFTPSTEARESVRSELGVASHTILVGLISRYHVVKNQANFLRAAAELRKRYSNVQFVMCGSGIAWDNQALQQLIRDLGLRSAIHLLGPRHDIPRIIAALDIATSASYGEGFPNAIGEAMACAVPCVATDVSDVSWIIKNAE